MGFRKSSARAPVIPRALIDPDAVPLEKAVEDAGDRLMASLGFRQVRFSQARATMQTPGIPDRRYVNRDIGVAFWWEAKRPKLGRQSTHQREFQADCEATGESYVLGDLAALEAFCVTRGWLREVRPGILMPVRSALVRPRAG